MWLSGSVAQEKPTIAFEGIQSYELHLNVRLELDEQALVINL